MQAPVAPPRPSALRPSALVAEAETGTPNVTVKADGMPGSDFMVDVIKSLDIAYVPCNPAQSFRGLHESLINYGGNKKPEFLTCTHEEASVAMAHGYFKIAGKPLLVLCHGTVGLQHAAMAIYNAWCDRVPVIVIGGNDLDASKRPPGVPTFHSAQDINALVRDFTKWDDQPVSLPHFAQSFVRAYKLAMTPPHEPVMLALDAGLQEETMHDRAKLTIPRYVPTSPPQGDGNAVREAARLLANAERPVIVADKCARTANGVKLLVELAEALQAPVVDQKGRMNFPNTHHLSQNARGRALIGQADVIIGLELSDYWGTVNGHIDNGDKDGAGLHEPRIKPNAKLISISSILLNTKANYQDFQRFQVVDVEMAADAEATLPALIEAVKQALPAGRKAAIEARGQAMKKAWSEARERTRQAAALRLGCEPDLNRAPGDGSLRADQGPRLVLGRRRPATVELAEPAVADGQALPPHRRTGRLRHRLRRAGRGRRRARQSRRRTLLGQLPAGRRPDVLAGRAVDRGASQNSAVVGDAQQPRLPSGSDARAAHVEPAQPRCLSRQGSRAARHAHRKSGHRLRQAREFVGRLFGRADQRSERAGAGTQEGGSGGQGRRAGAGRCRDAAALRKMCHEKSAGSVALMLTVGARGAAAHAASAEHGKAMFLQHGCWQCHGTQGQGSIATSGGKRLAPNPLPWEGFAGFVRSTNRAMPPYSEKILSDADLADIYAYLQSIPKPTAVKDIPLLK